MQATNLKLAALAWAAAKADMSYGRFIINLTARDKQKIYRQYQAMLEKRKAGPGSVAAEKKKVPSGKKLPKTAAPRRCPEAAAP